MIAGYIPPFNAVDVISFDDPISSSDLTKAKGSIEAAQREWLTHSTSLPEAKRAAYIQNIRGRVSVICSTMEKMKTASSSSLDLEKYTRQALKELKSTSEGFFQSNVRYTQSKDLVRARQAALSTDLTRGAPSIVTATAVGGGAAVIGGDLWDSRKIKKGQQLEQAAKMQWEKNRRAFEASKKALDRSYAVHGWEILSIPRTLDEVKEASQKSGKKINIFSSTDAAAKKVGKTTAAVAMAHVRYKGAAHEYSKVAFDNKKLLTKTQGAGKFFRRTGWGALAGGVIEAAAQYYAEEK